MSEEKKVFDLDLKVYQTEIPATKKEKEEYEASMGDHPKEFFPPMKLKKSTRVVITANLEGDADVYPIAKNLIRNFDN